MKQKTNLLQNERNSAILELDTSRLLRLEVCGRFMGFVDIWSGLLALYSRGEWRVYNLGEEREKQTE